MFPNYQEVLLAIRIETNQVYLWEIADHLSEKFPQASTDDITFVAGQIKRRECSLDQAYNALIAIQHEARIQHIRQMSEQ